MRINLHQIDTVIGDIDGNTEKIIGLIKKDISLGTGISVFPETAISGYTCGALWDRLDFVHAQENKIKEIADTVKKYPEHTVIVGFVSCNGINRAGYPKLYNAVACINMNKIQVYEKQLLANTDHHEDKKYFNPGNETKIFEISNGDETMKIGVPVCEDSWFESHTRNIPEEMVNLGAELLISINQSYFYYGKRNVRHELFSKIAKHNNVPVVTVNSCGVGDILKNVIVFDGGTAVYNRAGGLIKGPLYFNNDSIVTSKHEFEDSCEYMDPIYHMEKPNKYNEIFNALVFAQREFFKQCGIPKAQVHLSGGLDSSIVASIVAAAMGTENTVFITNPSKLNENSVTFKYAKQTADLLGVKLYINPIEDIYQLMRKVDEESFKDSGFEQKPQGYSTMHAVLRSVQAIAANHRFGTGIVSCGNHTENVLGWASFHDIGSIGVMQPLGDMTKLELFEFAAYINEIYGEEIIPKSLYDGKTKPAAELPDAMEDPINYAVQSGICADLIRSRKTKKDIITEFLAKQLNPDFYNESVYELSITDMHKEIDFAITQMKRSVYKNAQSAPIVMISPRSRGFSSRETLINAYSYM